MSVPALMADLARLGVRLEAHGDRLRYSPRSAVTPELAARMKSHKAELLAILRPQTDVPGIDLTNTAAVWRAALDLLDGAPLFPPEVMEGLRAADVRWAEVTADLADDPERETAGPDGWPSVTNRTGITGRSDQHRV